jgi:BirA family transcriptional regulator, biotin operon repressor / biotin---[acetyl-CoA-carboxylase] ligase
VNQTATQLPPDARVPAASLRTVDGRERDREEVLAALLRHLYSRYAAWRAGGLAALHEELAARDSLRGRAVTVGGVTGTAAGIDGDGRLVVATPDGDVVLESGEVVFG